MAASLLVRPWSLVALWPAASLGIVAAGYLRLGAGIYRKREGRLPAFQRWFFAPALVGQAWSLRHYRRQCRPWDAVTPQVLIGRQLSSAEAAEAIRTAGITAVLDLTAEFTESGPFLALAYGSLPMLDLTAPTPDQLQRAIAFLDEHTANGRVYVHCKVGYSRSAAVIGAWLLHRGIAADPEGAVARLRAVRPTLVVRPEAMVALRDFARDRAREEC